MNKQPAPTSTFLDILSQIDKDNNLSQLSIDQLKQIDTNTENVMIETINSIGAIGDLLFWSLNTEDPPVENVNQIGLLLRSLSDLLIKADFVRSEAVFHLHNNKA